MEAHDVGARGVGPGHREQRDPHGLLAEGLLHLVVHLDALVVVGLGVAGVVEGDHVVGLTEVRVEAGSAVEVEDPLHELGGILDVVGPVVDDGVEIHGVHAGLVRSGLNLLDGDGHADLGPLLREDHGNLLVDLVAAAHEDGDREAAVQTGLGEQRLGALDVRLDRVEGVVAVLAGGGKDGADGGAVTEERDVHDLLGVRGLDEGLAGLVMGEVLVLDVERHEARDGGGQGCNDAVGVALDLHEGGEGQVNGDVDIAALQLDLTGGVVGDNAELDVSRGGHAVLAIVGVGSHGHVLAALPLLDHVGAGAQGAVDVAIRADGLEVSLALDAQGKDAQVGERAGSLRLHVHDDGRVVGALDVVEVLHAHVPVGILGLDGAVERELPVLGGDGGAVGEGEAFLDLEGVGEAVVGDVVALGQAQLDVGAVVAGHDKALKDEVEDEDVGVADAGDGVQVVGVLSTADDDRLGIAVGECTGGCQGGKGGQCSGALEEAPAVHGEVRAHVSYHLWLVRSRLCPFDTTWRRKVGGIVRHFSWQGQ